MKLHVAPYIESLVPYPPGKPIEELEREYGISGSIKLASNENPLGPSPKAVAAISAALTSLHRYPDGSGYYLKEALAPRLGVRPDEIVPGNGSNEIIELLTTTFLNVGGEVITSHPTFLVYQKMVQARGGINRVVPLKDMRHDLDAVIKKITPRTRLIFLDNPNNPTGTAFSGTEFGEFLKEVPEHVMVVLDEAYVDFMDPKIRFDPVPFLNGPTPVVVLRTFSKAYGLAGLRIGYGLMATGIANLLNRVRQPFNVNTLAQVAGLAALGDHEHYEMTLNITKKGIRQLREGVERLRCRAFPTQTNFFLVDVGTDGRKLYQALLAKGVIVRPMEAYGFPNFIRITAGLPDENARLLAALAEVLNQ